MEWYLAAMRKYAQFDGRARRKEYWYFALMNAAIIIVLALLSIAGGSESIVLYALYNLAVLIPGMAVSVRRLHDTGKSGWWLLVSFVPLIGCFVLLAFMLQDSDPGENEFGPNPKESYTFG